MKRKGDAPINFHMVRRSQVKKELKIIATLPDEIIFNILLFLPTDILYAVMRYVCRQWHMIIDDPISVTTHLQRSTSIFLVQDSKFHGQYMYVRESDITFTNTKFEFPGEVLSTCNDWCGTEDMITLPSIPLNGYWCCLGFASSSNTYKVVVVTRDRCCKRKYVFRYGCAILTVNVDRAWRRINCAEIVESRFIFTYQPIMNREFMYCIHDYSRILALNIKYERIKTISLPKFHPSHIGEINLIPKGNTISAIYANMDHSIKVWVLKDLESEDWTEFPDLSVEEIRREVTNLFSLRHLDIYNSDLHSISWFKNEEKILFKMVSVNSLFVYDVKTGGACAYIIDIDGGTMKTGLGNQYEPSSPIFPHLSSLTLV